jgi:hypothetical protein
MVEIHLWPLAVEVLVSGTSTLDAPLNIVDNGFQFYIDNDSDDTNNWYIGATNDTWVAGDQLILVQAAVQVMLCFA